MAKTWNDSYKLNINEIDNQHIKLFEILDRLIDAMSVGKARESAPARLAELDSYARIHFGNEERYMKQFNYAGMEDHMEAHQFFYNKMNDFKISLNGGSLSVSTELMTFLRKWIVNHIQVTDKKYVPFFTSHGVK